MKTIWKFNLNETGLIDMPKGARVLGIAPSKNGAMCLYAAVESEAETEQRRIVCVETGKDAAAVELAAAYVGSYSGFHVFDMGPLTSLLGPVTN